LIAGIPAEKMKVISDSAAAAEMFNPEMSKNIFVLHELYRPNDAAAVKRALMALADKEVQ
jgi:hypothetical protein